ncbi:DNA polymerase III subunit delta' [Heyndrickxia sporothermodurans]|uniref:DNA polymerase III delta prime subunit n=1 Tax=Heyndrickxia sporothermodurans TaxID=46224 RepID=A0A150KRS0_9BACI|nr:DNA polymerase III subunit delta' [Heyndrickxia sporothermodurans]KYD00943.1 DNA polymerase III delta prime subunit [Heyndrickxia sporothermodurans]MBL5768900.1 DNA polymerase III subunit delta' [Heyndrickxia sporothermodurans]MBL5772663.1 DNA polymerase III subunit delta' [Heyndrickxia sporothermodurans]MBL5776158.1 DNA polymerase III subunit delta' [Heyndrickxia sporothermodurans]MBL5779696.1 DNA polymerase III subunit delta' [Heyndrickxia sporothermodurans]
MFSTWDELEKVQPLAAKTLKNSLLKNRVAHAYLFEGESGLGKKEVSLLFAKSLFCLEIIDGTNPCEQCSNCRRINSLSHPDVHFLEPDGQSIKKEQIKALQQEFSKSGVESKKKLYTIVHANKMTVNAANSLLKFLEEPNAQTTAILITEQIQQIIPTILSRCQVVSFKPYSFNELQEKLILDGISPTQAPLLANLTNDPLEANRLNNDDWFAQARKIVLKLYEVLGKGSLFAMVELQEDWYNHFKEKNQLDLGLDLLLFIYKDLLSIQIGKNIQLIYPERKAQFERDVIHLSPVILANKMAAILEAKRKLHGNMNPQLLMEQLVLKLQGGSTFV